MMKRIGKLWGTPIERLSLIMVLLALIILLFLLWREFLLAGVAITLLSILGVHWYNLGSEHSVIYLLKKHHGQRSVQSFTQGNLQKAITRLEKKHIIEIVGQQIKLLDRNTPCFYDKFRRQSR